MSKFTKSLLAFSVLTGLLIPQFGVLAQGSLEEDAPFPDVTELHYNFDAVKYLKDTGAVQGYPDGSFRPQNTINRAEFLKIVMETAGIEPAGDDCFPDVHKQWYSGYVCEGLKRGFIKGFLDGEFKAGKTIAFTEASKITLNILGEDVTDALGEKWYEKYIESLEERDAIPAGVDSLTYNLSRAEMSEMIWTLKTDPADRITNSYKNILAGEGIYVQTPEDLIPFTTCTELKTHITENVNSYDPYGYSLEEDVMSLSPSQPIADAVNTSAGESSAKAVESGGGGSDDFSATNVQVSGVDEADIVKNDGEYIYTLTGNTVRIIKAFPADALTEVAKIEVADQDFSPEDMYLDGDQLVLIGSSYESYESPIEPMVDAQESLSYSPYYRNQALATVLVYDVSDHANPTLEDQFELEGSIASSRKIGDTVYLVSNYNSEPLNIIEPLPAEPINLLPELRTGEEKTIEPVNGCTDVYYLPETKDTQMITVTAIPLDGGETTSKTVIGSASDIYASADNMYIAQNKSDWWWRSGWRSDSSHEETIIHKFSLSPTEIDYIGKASVPGRIINQFAMDEHENHFRIATTVGHSWQSDPKSQNNIYTLNAKMKQVGQIEGIASGEEIFSVRFMGDRGYMVTFKKVDPFFVLDLSDPANPKILGELKIPGFSDYLHPLDENHIIGFGLDTVDASELLVEDRDLAFAWFQGVKIAMFDVTDVHNPTELHREIIGDRGTTTPLSNTHKALLWAPEKGQDGKTLFSLPVELYELTDEEKNTDFDRSPPRGDFAGQYAYVYDVSVEDGFEFRKRITHQLTDEVVETPGTTFLQDYARNINRILYIGNQLYTVAPEVIGAFDLDKLTETNELELEGVESYYPYWY